ncbi:MAG: hypothetical protein ABW061_12485 [Polyangiaceae bacterium]
MRVVAGLLGCVWLAACGGKLSDGASREAGGAFSAGAPGALGAGASNGGASNGGGEPPFARAGSPAQTCSEDNSWVVCAESCGSEQSGTVMGECRAGQWVCPAPLVDPETCPTDACVLQRVKCCDRQFGKLSAPPCAANGRFGACPDGLERNPPMCIADSAHTTDCSTLFDQSCSLQHAWCEWAGVHCECVADDGGLVWKCAIDVL